MGLIEKSDIRSILSHKEIINGVVKQALKNPSMVDALTDEVADKMLEELQKNNRFKKRLIIKALGTQIFKDSIVKKLK